MATDAEIVGALGSVGRAFFGGFRELREVQRQSIPLIQGGRDVLVASATASGKTEAVMAPLVARTAARAGSGATGIRVLAVAPTRALVNDLAARLAPPLERIGHDCGRQTSDHRDKGRRPFLLITTPESFDSMLVRDATLENGRVVGHLLAGVLAVFVDEAHLFDGTARGDQLCWLLGRLRRIRRLTTQESSPGALQICGGSATISDPEGLARRLLGEAAIAVRVPGARDIEVFGPSDDPAWFSLDASLEPPALRDRLELTPAAGFAAAAEARIWQALSGSAGTAMRKALVFVPSRNLCDTLSAHLRTDLPRHRDLQVLAHHGSLDRVRRESAENTFASARDAVLVATTTLEVGVDIGDVDLVVLVGAPPGTRSLLQRIGRAGRRLGHTRVLALPRTGTERAALASMLIAARDGALEEEGYAPRWSVFVQQAASFVAQGRPRGRRRADLLDLAQDVWPEHPPTTAQSILNALVDDERLVDIQGRMMLGDAWADQFDKGAGGMHANLDSAGTGIPVVDSSTGEVIAHVAERPASDRGLALGGQVWDARYVSGEVLVSARQGGAVRDGFRYATRGGPTGLEYATHVRRGLGFADGEAPIVSLGGGSVWLHFGGSAYQAVLVALMPSLRPVGPLSGLGVAGQITGRELERFASQGSVLTDVIEALADRLENTLALGPYQRDLPPQVRTRTVLDLFGISAFRAWLASRSVWGLSTDDHRLDAIQAAVFER